MSYIFDILDFINLRFILYPVIGALLGFSTNYIAIFLLFHPKRKVLGFQGLLEKRKIDIAENVSLMIAEHFFNADDIQKLFDEEKIKNSIRKVVHKINKVTLFKSKSDSIMTEALFLTVKLSLFEKDTPYLKKQIVEMMLHNDEIKDLIYEKIVSYDISELERIIKDVSNTEINFIIMSGGFLGILIGLIQAFLPF